MYSGVMALGGPHKAEGILASLYFVLLVILGNCILETIRSAQQIVSTEVLNGMVKVCTSFRFYYSGRCRGRALGSGSRDLGSSVAGPELLCCLVVPACYCYSASLYQGFYIGTGEL